MAEAVERQRGAGVGKLLMTSRFTVRKQSSYGNVCGVAEHLRWYVMSTNVDISYNSWEQYLLPAPPMFLFPALLLSSGLSTKFN